MKKTNRKLIPAVAMLLISAIMLSTSSFAWFTINNQVTATGMSVTAKADSSLLIAGADDEFATFSDTATTTVAGTNMKPCTSADGIKFAKLASGVKVAKASESKATWNGEGNVFQAADLEEATGTTYVIKGQYKLKSAGGDLSDVYVSSVTVGGTSASHNFAKSIRVAVECGGTTKVFNPKGGTVADEGAGKHTGSWTLAPQVITTPGSSAVLGSTVGSTPVTVTVKIWFEGQDNDCFTDNIKTDAFTVDVVFKSDAVGAA